MKFIATLLLALATAATPPQEGKPAKSAKTALTAATFRKGQFRLGYDFQADPPLKGWKTIVGGEPFLFFDLDEDGALTVEKDGLAIPGAPFVVPIPDVLLTKGGQFELEFEGTTHLALTRQDLGRWQSMASESALLTTLRIQAGVRPAKFDSKASEDCEKHCEYLKLNGLTDGWSGMSLHDEDPKKKGYTPEGAAAGKGSDISPQTDNAKAAYMGWYQSVWHRVYMVSSGLKSFGFTIKYGVALLYFLERSSGDRIQMHPPDGATGVPLAFDSSGELPNPVPKTDNGKGSGFPILVLLGGERSPLLAAKVADAAGRPVRGTQSCPARPANSEWPTNSGCAVFVPARPLAPNTIYKVRFVFKDADKPIEWSFTTGR